MKISKKETQLINEFRRGEKVAREKLYNDCRRIMHKTINEYELKTRIKAEKKEGAKPMVFDREKRENLVVKLAEKVFKLLDENDESKIKKSFYGYIKMMARNILVDDYRMAKSKKSVWTIAPVIHETGASPIDVLGDPRAIIPGSKKYYGELSEKAYVAAHKNLSSNTKDGIERCLDYIKDLYDLKEIIKVDPSSKILDILLDAREKLLYRLGRKIEKQATRFNELHSKVEAKEKRMKELFPPDRILSNEEFDRIQRKYPDFSLLTPSESREYDDLFKQRRWWITLDKINKQIDSQQACLRRLVGLPPICWIMSPPHIPNLSESERLWRGYLHDYLINNIKDFRVKPSRLLFEVLIKLDDIKKGKYLDRGKILLIFYHLKKATVGTKKELLFKSINESNFYDEKLAIRFFENMRKSTDKDPRNKEFYEILVNIIYDVSFVEKIDINNDQELGLYYTRKTRPKSYAFLYGNISIKEAALLERESEEKRKN